MGKQTIDYASYQNLNGHKVATIPPKLGNGQPKNRPNHRFHAGRAEIDEFAHF